MIESSFVLVPGLLVVSKNALISRVLFSGDGCLPDIQPGGGYVS